MRRQRQSQPRRHRWIKRFALVGAVVAAVAALREREFSKNENRYQFTEPRHN